MPVQEFECQIARGQIGRYLSGEALSAEGLRQLGAHVAECSECKGFLDHRKAALQGMLGETSMPTREQAHAVVDVNPSEALIAQIRARSEAEEPAVSAPTPVANKPVKPILTKPILYCGLLGIVLVGMTYMTRNPSGLLGPHASQIVAASPPAADEKTPETSKPLTTPPAATASDSSKATTAANSSKVKAVANSVPAASTLDPASKTTTKSTEPDKKAGSDKPTDTEKSTGVAIAPTKSANSSLIVNTESSEQAEATGSDKPANAGAKPINSAPAPAKAKSVTPNTPGHVVSKRQWRRRTSGRRRWSLHHLRPGTGAIHVYRS